MHSWEDISGMNNEFIQHVAQFFWLGEELGSLVSYLRSQIHLLMSIATVRPFDMVGHFPSFNTQPS
jgi:hypothetical protein